MQQVPQYGGQQGYAPPAPQQAFGGPPVDPYDMLEGGKRAIKFVQKDQNGFDQHAPVGTQFTGLIVGDLRTAPVTNFTTKQPETWPDGRPKLQLVMDLQTDLRDPQDPTDDGRRSLYVKNQMLAAFQQAVEPTKHLGKIGEGTRVTVTLVGYKDTGKGNPQKLYEITIGPEFVPYVDPAQRQTNQAIYGQPVVQPQQYQNPAQPAFPGQVVPAQQQVPQGYPQQVQAAQQAGFPSQATQPQAPQVNYQPQVPQAQQFPAAVQPQGVAAVGEPSPALAALNAIAQTPAPQAVAPEAAQAGGIDQGTVDAFNTLRQNGIDPHTAINSLASRLAPGNEAAFSGALAQAVGVPLA